MKLLIKPKIAAAIAIICDLLALAAAVVLDAVRSKVPASYSFDHIQVRVDVAHPYEYFGIATAVLLALAAVMTGFVIAGALAGGKAKMVMRLVGAAALLIVSVAVIIFAHFFVCGAPVEDTACFVLNSGDKNIAIQETKYSFGMSTMDIYTLNGEMHYHEDGAEAHPVEVTHITGTDIMEFSKDPDRYIVDEVFENELFVRFMDGGTYRTLQFTIK